MPLVEVHPGEIAEAQVAVREAGGDNEVPRDGKGRPLIVTGCWLCDGTGKRLNPKTNRLNKCQGCEGTGSRTKAYTRTTSYIDVLEDKSNLQAWGERMVLLGVNKDMKILNGISELDPESKDGKNILNRKAQVAKQVAGAEKKSERGTYLHGLSELVDAGELLPSTVSFEDVLDMQAYREALAPFEKVHSERLVVQDKLRVAGTPDRVVSWSTENENKLIAPDGDEILPDEPVIEDLKTGTVEYGGLKMCMQLAIYANSELYDHESHERSPIENVNKKWGIITNIPAGSGEATLYWADLTLGWEAVQVAGQVRAMRTRSSKALTQFAFSA